MNAECVTCKHAGNCATVTPENILNHFVCLNYEEVGEQVTRARCDIITMYGERGLLAIISPEEET